MGPNCVWSLCMAILPAIFIAVFILNIEWLFLTWSLDLWDELCVKITIFHRLLNDVPRGWTAFWVNLVLKFQSRGGRGRFLFWKSGYISIWYSLHIDNLKSPACASKQDVLKLATLQYPKYPTSQKGLTTLWFVSKGLRGNEMVQFRWRVINAP